MVKMKPPIMDRCKTLLQEKKKGEGGKKKKGPVT
jgi:hypothetical protein